ncbi:hypothetical protein PSA7680_03592 [Pseudoruegeria aquimaris]|uniref:Uncharacterized protein n=1 Tax=Pseudoruegeria aquimaris TaxID=393663 RepID=A0A1Y5TRH0_9RHOB|nr:hypothetical protein [Pseudoruegeria aquimaris]SLN68034.1 hypothetical protein PSA7680_03592 [Pseudoruegeria aquimaris]
MAEPQEKGRPVAGIYSVQSRDSGSRAADRIAAILTAVWIVLVGGFLFVMRDAPEALSGLDPVQFVMVLMAVFLPVAMIWIGAWAAKSSRIMREESARLQAAIDALRQSYIAQQKALETAPRPDVEKKLEEIAARTKETEDRIATFTSSREKGETVKISHEIVRTATEEGQAALELGTPAEALQPPLSRADFIRALNFPEDVDDVDGFAALRLALKHRDTAKLVQAAQDVLTLLSEEGIYMDDLRPDRARPEVWRAFAAGERGRAVAPLGGIRDRSSLALTAARMRADPIFRDAAHHFLRQFDTRFAEFAEGATDAEIAAFSSTRTARAFMLLGRVSGTFN